MNLLQQSLGSFVWSKIGTETGQSISDILHRKEVERQANDGYFTWGIGSSLGQSIERFMWCEKQPKVVFTKMRSKPKDQDVNPTGIMLWKSYHDNNGEQELPLYSFLISSIKPKSSQKHYALLCYSEESITEQCYGVLNSKRLVNYLSDKGVGGSQVTAVVKNTENSSAEEGDYSISFVASLCGAGQVVLADGVEISEETRDEVMRVAREGDIEKWKKLIEQTKAM